MNELWPEQARAVAFGDGPDAPHALHLRARAETGKPPVLLVHGFRGSAADWGPLAERLGHTRDVWAPDLATTGAGMPPVHGLLDRLHAAMGAETIDVVASSMGGYVAASWLSTGRPAVGRLTMLAPALVPLQPMWRLPGLTRLIALQKALDADERRWESEVATSNADEFFARETPRHLDIPREWREALLAHQRATVADAGAAGRRHARQEIVRALMSTLRRRGAVARLVSRLTMPVLWLHGDADGLVPFGPSQQVASMLPDCSFERLPGCGHVPHLECADLVASTVAS